MEKRKTQKSPTKHSDMIEYKLEILDNQDAQGALEGEKEFSEKSSQRQRRIILKIAELQRQTRLI